MRQLPPLPVRDKYWKSIEEEINRLFFEVIYNPLLAVIAKPSTQLMNTGSALLEAIRAGTVWHQDGHFSGQFNSKLTKELRAVGAVYNAPSKTWSLIRELLPVDIRFAQAAADDRYDKLRRGFLRTLDDMRIESIDKLSTTEVRYRQTIDWMEDDFQKALGAITVPVKLTNKQRQLISSQWGTNLDKYIKDWTEQNIIKLRNEIQANTFAGHRSVDLIDMLKSNYGVSQRKAKFLARQETSLLMSKFRESRYKDAGVKRYKWSTSHDERVRHDHKDLNGKIYSWDSPPVTNRRTGQRNHPGEDFGCRCVAIALVE